MSLPAVRIGIAIPILLTLASCGSQNPSTGSEPVAVETLLIKAEPIPNIVELPGRIEAVRSAEVRARTDGIVQRRLYEEGSYVTAGTPLFMIDQRDYRAQVQSSEAALKRATAARENAASVVLRYGPLIDERAVSAQEYDTARSDLRQADAQVAEARAALDRSKLLLSYTLVRAPIAGRVGRAEVTEGALVTGSAGTLMTRIDQASPVYAVFTASSASILDTAAKVKSGALKVPSLSRVEVRLELENGETYATTGHLDFTSPVVDPETGSRTIRAQFDNPDGMLIPGQFVRGRMEAGTIASGISVPARSVQINGEQASVAVLGADGTVVNRPVSLGELTGKRWIIRSGLKQGERIIVDGWSKLRPGQKAKSISQPGSQATSPIAPAKKDN